MPVRRTPQLLLEVLPERPRVRGDCIAGPRPCPWVSCRYHLAVDVVDADGTLIANQLGPGRHRTMLAPRQSRAAAERFANQVVAALERSPTTCALDVADKGSMVAREVAALLSVDRERVGQIEVDGKARMRAAILGEPLPPRGVRTCELCGATFTSVRWQLYCPDPRPCAAQARQRVVTRARARWAQRQVAKVAYRRARERCRRLVRKLLSTRTLVAGVTKGVAR